MNRPDSFTDADLAAVTHASTLGKDPLLAHVQAMQDPTSQAYVASQLLLAIRAALTSEMNSIVRDLTHAINGHYVKGKASERRGWAGAPAYEQLLDVYEANQDRSRPLSDEEATALVQLAASALHAPGALVHGKFKTMLWKLSGAFKPVRQQHAALQRYLQAYESILKATA